jgi:NAD(P)H-dependent FMN reductase
VATEWHPIWGIVPGPHRANPAGMDRPKLILRLLHFSPGTATPRHDSHRAALVFCDAVQQASRMLGADIALELVWALPALTSQVAVTSMLSGADGLVVATPTYGQGSPWMVRRFFELSAGVALWGRLGTAFATAGGLHTGGEVAVADTLRSMQGLGLCTFTFAQKYVVLGAQQKFAADGEFDLIDVWFLRQLARTSVAQLIAFRDRESDAFQTLGLETSYYRNFPSEAQLEDELGEIRRLANAPLTAGADAYAAWTRRLGFPSQPPNADGLPFGMLLPEPS